MTMISSVGPSVGYDHGSPVSERYRGSFPFEGKLHRLDIDVLRLSEADRAQRRRGGRALGHGPAVGTVSGVRPGSAGSAS